MTEAAVAGFMINLAYFGLIKFGSPLTTHIAGSTKTALQTLIGIALFSNKVTPLNAAGIALTLLGSTLYSMERTLDAHASRQMAIQSSGAVFSRRLAVSNNDFIT